MESQCSNILSAPPDLAKQIQEYLDEQLFGSVLIRDTYSEGG